MTLFFQHVLLCDKFNTLSFSPCLLLCFQRYGSDGLKLVSHEETVSFGQAVLKLTFDPGLPDDGMLTAECRLDHPFFVKNKGKIKTTKVFRAPCETSDQLVFSECR